VNSRISEQILDPVLEKVRVGGTTTPFYKPISKRHGPRSRTTGLSIMISVASSSSFSAFTAQGSPDDGDPSQLIPPCRPLTHTVATRSCSARG